ncbi:hypothetical protein R1flu_003545 [Riccia fluitans]|uniref:Mitochondrial import inner membrane translocase subunit TIM50 n=1 Tax=Riccia fluitans TaxID=41844 RepID=A0ABD1Y9D7_9MARC
MISINFSTSVVSLSVSNQERDECKFITVALISKMQVGNKKLLILHLKGFLVDCYHEYDDEKMKRPSRRPHAKCNQFYVYKRPGCEEFLDFCFENFVVGVWSAAYPHTVEALLDFALGEFKSQVAFTWNGADHCTDTGLQHPGRLKPLVRKELTKLWNAEYGVPWEKGDFGPHNTILLESDPTKIVENPPHTAIMLKTYRVTDPEDDELEKLQKYLELLADAKNVQEYMELKPFAEFKPEDDDDVKEQTHEEEYCRLDDSESLDLLIKKALLLKGKDDSSRRIASPLNQQKGSGGPGKDNTGRRPVHKAEKNYSIKVYNVLPEEEYVYKNFTKTFKAKATAGKCRGCWPKTSPNLDTAANDENSGASGTSSRSAGTSYRYHQNSDKDANSGDGSWRRG